MEDARFTKIADGMMNMLTAAMSGIAPGDVQCYNAYFNGTEVVVLGYTYQAADGHRYTKPICIAVDPEVMEKLRVDHETGRFEGGPEIRPGKVV